jgi:hypothetical protein
VNGQHVGADRAINARRDTGEVFENGIQRPSCGDFE